MSDPHERPEVDPEQAEAGPADARGQQAGQEHGGEPEATQHVSFWTIVLSTMAAAIGVQSQKNKERDFASGRVAPFIVAGLIFTVLFVVTVVMVVKLVLSQVG